jgi:hypothetical protein
MTGDRDDLQDWVRQGPNQRDDGSRPLTPWEAWLSMFGIRAPLSGDVSQDIAPSISGQLGLFNIDATRSGDPALEQRIITEVASYGRQLGWLLEAVDVLAQRQSRRGLGEADLHALDQVHALAEQVAAVKDPRTNAEAIRRVREALPEQ